MITETAAYLNFTGDCAEAIALYQRVLGAELTEHMTWGDMPGDVPEDMAARVMHAQLTVGKHVFYVSDLPPGRELPAGPNRCSVLMQFDDPDHLDRVFAGLAEDGEATSPPEDTFWNARFGICVDRFGVTWMMNCQRAASAG
jgi:PhnB protein